MAAPCDLNVPWCKLNDTYCHCSKMCHRLGYKAVAINNIWSDSSTNNSDKKKRNKEKLGPQKAAELKLRKDELSQLGLKVYTRFTMVMSDSGQGRLIQKEADLQSYDILAVQPTNEKTFNIACKELSVDIISLDLSERLPFNLKRATVGVALERGVHFEICYSPMLRDSTARRNIISTGQMLVSVLKGKNIIFSSCCKNELELRAQYDVMNLGATLFGMKPDQAKAAMTTNCRSLLLHADSRRTEMGTLKLTPRTEVKVKDTWLLDIDGQGDLYSSSEESNSDPADGELPAKKLKKS